MRGRKSRLAAVVILILLLIGVLLWKAGPDDPGEAPVRPEELIVQPWLPGEEPTPGSEIRETVAFVDPPSRREPAKDSPFGLPGLEPPKARRASETWLTGMLVGPTGAPLTAVEVYLEPTLGRRVVTRKDPKSGRERTLLEIYGRGRMDTLVHGGGRMIMKAAFVGNTDAQGRFEIPVPAAPGRYRVSFRAPGSDSFALALHRTGGYVFSKGDRRSIGTVRVPRGGRIRGTVVGEDGKPVYGASVWYWPDTFGETREELIASSERPVEGITHSGFRGMQSWNRGGLGRTETGPDGTFAIMGVIPSTVTVFAKAPGDPSVRSAKDILVNEGEEIAGIRISVLTAVPPLIQGRVVDAETGEPVKAGIRLKYAKGMRISRIYRCRPDGTFIAGSLAPDVYTLVAIADGYRTANSGPHRLNEGESLCDLTIRIRKPD